MISLVFYTKYINVNFIITIVNIVYNIDLVCLFDQIIIQRSLSGKYLHVGISSFRFDFETFATVWHILFLVLFLKHYCFLLRYVREWLGSMVAAEIVLMTEDNRYYIPQEVLPEIKSLTTFTAILPASAKRIDDLYNCFQLDGPTGNYYKK